MCRDPSGEGRRDWGNRQRAGRRTRFDGDRSYGCEILCANPLTPSNGGVRLGVAHGAEPHCAARTSKPDARLPPLLLPGAKRLPGASEADHSFGHTRVADIAVWSPSGEFDAVEGEDLGETVEVRVAVEHGKAAMRGGGSGDERVGDGHSVVPVAALGEFAERPHRGVRDAAVVAQDPQGVELEFQRDVFGAAAGGVEDLHPHDRRDPEAISEDRFLNERAKITWQRRHPPPGGCVGDKRCVPAQQLPLIQGSDY